jgi:hypothetical protein|eukprot:COSAG01_NODE_8_length_44037_cov_102.614593_3_plen_78_part_00
MLEFVELAQVSTLLEKGSGEGQERNQNTEQKKSEPLLRKDLQQDILLIMLKLINQQRIVKRKVGIKVGTQNFERLSL